ncbi:MAG: hypothetical protein IM631_12900 [Cytophagales bacterium]|jgi:hypothetical protein|nr:hypothetical protein [Cytophagales bacterium]MCA6372271.1 hypothetical protein [Cytophagales bacterium]MCA6382416.1 hypothetical protein [Cytophagales bacterium]
MKTVNIETLKDIARNLLQDGANTEYARGICELIADVDGLPEVDHGVRSVQIGEELNVYKPERMYS